jgi:hypothetical protein
MNCKMQTGMTMTVDSFSSIDKPTEMHGALHMTATVPREPIRCGQDYFYYGDTWTLSVAGLRISGSGQKCSCELEMSAASTQGAGCRASRDY